MAHDLRNALNAVAVNLEVVRGRSARGGEAATIAPFAANAATQFEAAAAAAEALLGFTRPESGPADVAAIVGRLGRLLAVRGSAVLEVTGAGARGALTAASADVVRATVARSVLTALGAGGPAACEITAADRILLRVTGGDASVPSLDPELTAVAAAHDVQIVTRRSLIELTFPALGTDVTPHAPA